MDIEGFEIRALQGMSRFLEEYDVELIFLEFRFLVERGNGVQHGADILAFLSSRGYAPLKLRDQPRNKLDVTARTLRLSETFTTRFWDWTEGNNAIFRKVGMRALYHHPLIQPGQRL